MTKSRLIAPGLALALTVGFQNLRSQTAPSQSDRVTTRSSQKAKADSEQSGTLSGKHVDLSEGTKISAELVSSIDAQTAKPGDQVVARATKSVKEHGQTVVRRGDELVGRITEVKAAGAADAGSSLAITFDHLVQGGATSQLSAVINSIVSTPTERRAQQQQESEPMLPAGGPVLTGGGSGSGRAAGGGGGLLGGVGSTVNSTVNAAASTAGSATTTAGSTVGSTVNSATSATTSAAGNVAGAATGAVSANSRTALGNTTNAMLATPRHAIHLSTQAEGSQQTGADSVLSTRKGDLRLEQGTEMQFRVVGRADAK